MSTEKIKLMTYNIGFSAGLNGLVGAVHSKEKIINNLNAIVNMLLSYQPDILALQEIDMYSKRSCYINQVQYLQKILKYKYSAIAMTWDCPYVPYPISFNFKAHFGRVKAAQVIFSKYPITNNFHITFKKPKNNPWWYNLFYINRLAQFLTIQCPNGREIMVVNVQLDAFHCQEREHQLQQIQDQLKMVNIPHILCGDINSIPKFQQKIAPFSDEPTTDYSSHVMEKLSESYTLAPFFNTYPSHRPNRQLDYILVSPELKRASLNVIKMKTSK